MAEIPLAYGKMHREQNFTTYIDDNKYVKANVGKKFDGHAPDWVTQSQNPNSMGIKANNDGVFQKNHECVMFYWCTKCTNQSKSIGKCNKNHPSKLHDQEEAKKKNKYKGKRGSYSQKREGDQEVKALQAEIKWLKKQHNEKS